MFLILDADSEFTANGKTAMLPGPVGVPCRGGNSHAVCNPSDKPAMWVNFQVGDPNSSSGGSFHLMLTTIAPILKARSI